MPKKTQMQGKPVRKKEGSWLNEDVRASTGLPPQVYGQVRCFCKLSVSQVVWTIPKPPDLALVRVKWWGEEGDGALFRPVDVKKSGKAGCQTTARYPVRSGPCQFATYLSDMGSLTLDLMTSPNSEVIGQATITQIGLLTNSRPINGFFPVMSANGQKLANLQVSIVLEPLLASYDNMGAIPTTDITMENGRSYDSMVVPVNSHPLPYTDLPKRPDNTVFISPSSINDVGRAQSEFSKTYFDGGLRQQLTYGLPPASASDNHQQHPDIGAVAITTSGDVVSLPESRSVGSGGGLIVSNAVNSNISRSRGLKSPTRSTGSMGKDILSVLVDKGTKLREAMIVSSMHADVNANRSVKINSDKAKTLKSPSMVNSAEAVAFTEGTSGSSRSALDILMTSPVRNQDFQFYSLMNGLSPGSSMSSDMGYGQMMSDLDDPMHENSIIHELFYHNSDNEGLGFSDISGYDKHHDYRHHSPDNRYMSLPARLPGGSGGDDPLVAEGNQRPPSRTSSLNSLNMIGSVEDEDGLNKRKKTKRRARSRSRSSSRSHSQTRSRSTTSRSEKTLKKPGVKDINLDILKDPKSLKPKKKVRSRSSSRSRSQSRPRRRKSSTDRANDSGRLSSAQSENSRDMNEQKQDGLSVERLTLLGRVHVARVNIDCLQLRKTDLLDTSDSQLPASKLKIGRPPRPQISKKPCTFFVEYQFPVVATSRVKQTSNAIATEVTRIASKNIKDGAVIFKHRSVFPILFDGASVERWWKSALVFRLYCREAAQQAPILIGSGGISLKSVLRSENLFVQREIEILDTSKNILHNNSLTSSLNSSLSARSNASVFGNLKVSVELASDHKEFPTIMAHTKLAEMSGNVKIIPVDGVPREQTKLVEQLKKNMNEPLIKSPTKKIDVSATASQSPTRTAVTKLPPQSPRRKAEESPSAELEESDEMSKLKQQLKATLAVLNNPNSQKHHAASHLSFGANMTGVQRETEASTLQTLLYIQEGRKITLHGVPPLHMVNKYPGLLQAHPEAAGQDSVTRNTYLVCRMFWTNDEVHSDVCWGTLNPEYNFFQIAPVLMTSTLLERMRDNYMIVEVWDKKVSAENDKLIGMVKLSLHQFYLSFRERKIANALLKSEYPVMAVDNYMPIVDPFSGLHFGQLKVVLAMGSELQIINLQRLALGTAGVESLPMNPSSYLERQDLLKNGGSAVVAGKAVEHQFEVIVEGLRGLKLFENMIWGEADCFVQFFFPAEGDEENNGLVTMKSIPTMKCFRTATTLCIPDPTFHDTFHHKLTLPLGIPVQRELLTACANSGGSVTGLPFEVWCRYYHPNVRDQLIAKCTLPLTKVCAMITMHKSSEPCVQSFSLRLSPVGVDGRESEAETSAKTFINGKTDGKKVPLNPRVALQYIHVLTVGDTSGLILDSSAIAEPTQTENENGDNVVFVDTDGQTIKKHIKDAGVLDVTVNYKCHTAMLESTSMALNRNQTGSQVCLSVGIIRAAGLKAAADSIARLDSSMAYSADVGVNAYVRISVSFLGKENERVTKTVARSFAPEFAHWMDFPCPVLVSRSMASDATSLAELLESSQAVFEVWHQMPTGLNRDLYVDKNKSGIAARKVAHQTGDVLLGTAVVPLVSLLTRRTGLNGWFAINLPSLGWTKPVADNDNNNSTAIDQLVGGLELSIRFARQEDRDHVVSVARSVGWSPVDVGVEQPDWQDEDSHHSVHNITVSVEQASFSLASALITGHSDLDPQARGYVRYKLYDKGAVVSKSRKLHASDGSLLCSLDHKHSFMLSHTAPLQWYLREEKLEVQVWVTFDHGGESEKKPRQRDKLIGSCFIDLDSLTDMRRRQQRISGIFPLFKPGANNLKAAFIKAHIVSRVSSRAKEQNSENEKGISESEVSVSASETECYNDAFLQTSGDITMNRSPKKRKTKGQNPETSFGVVVAVERAMHLPMVTERNRSGEIIPTTYVSFQSAEMSRPTCSCIFPNSTNPVWDYTVETRLSTEYLYKENKNLVLKVWHKPSEARKAPDKSCDRVLGFVSVDLTSLMKGLQQICGWYNIMDFNGQCRGQIKVSITPLDKQGVLPSASTGSSFLLPTFVSRASSLENTRAVASSIAQQLVSLQHQVMQRMGALTGENGATSVAGPTVSTSQEVESVTNVGAANPVPAAASSSHWKPQFVPVTRTDDPSKSFLFSSLRRQLQDLDTITQRLKTRLEAPTQVDDGSEHQINSARSGDILTGTQSDLSTIHATSMLMNTRESSEPSPYAFSFEVGTSQESARSHTMNNSSRLDNDADYVRMHEDTSGSQGHRLTDSGVFSAKNLSDKSGEVALDSHSVESELTAVAFKCSNLSALPQDGAPPYSGMSVDTVEARFLALAVTNPQTLQSVVENSENSGNSHGFVPHTQRSNLTESFAKELCPRKNGPSNGMTSNNAREIENNESQHAHSSSLSARSDAKTVEESEEAGDYVSDEEEEDEEGPRSGRYGSYHRYREMLDAEELERDGAEEEDEVVEIVPRSLNNISTVMALGASVNCNSAKITDENLLESVRAETRDVSKAGCEVDTLAFSPASPNVNLEGTSVWCSEDNDDSFFQQVFKTNNYPMGQTKEDVDETTLDGWLLEHSDDASKIRLENWLEVHRMDKSRRHLTAGASSEVFGHRGIANEQDAVYKQRNDGRAYPVKHSENIGDQTEERTHREEMFLEVGEKDREHNLESDSEHDGEDTSNVWNQIIDNSSDEETSRNLRTKKQSLSDHSTDQNKETTAKLKSLNNKRRAEEKSISQTDIPLPATKDLLSGVELLDSVTMWPQNRQTSDSTHSLPTEQTSADDNRDLQVSDFNRASTLASNQTSEYPFTLELADTNQYNQYTAQGARPKLCNLLSIVDLDSNSSTRPHSETSHASKVSEHSQTNNRPKASLKSRNSSLNSEEISDKASKISEKTLLSDKSGHSSSETSAGSSHISASNQMLTSNIHENFDNGIGFPRNRNNSNVFTEANKPAPRVSRTGHDSTTDSAYADGDYSRVFSTQPNSLLMINGMHAATEDSTTEDSGIGHAKDGIDCYHTAEEPSTVLPNFFMSETDMQASIKALQMAKTAANVNKDEIRSQNKVKAVTELVSKMTSSKLKAVSVSVKNKQPPSAEETKRIAKIFSSKMS